MRRLNHELKQVKHITFCYVCQGQWPLDVALGGKPCVVASQWHPTAGNPLEPVSLSLELVALQVCPCCADCQHSMTEMKKPEFCFPFFKSEWEKERRVKKCASLISVFPFMAEILNGGVKISNNPKLCNMDTVLWNDIIDTSRKPLTVLDFASNLSSCKY